MFTSGMIVFYLLAVSICSRRRAEVVLSLAEAQKRMDTAKAETREEKRKSNFKTYWPLISMFINCKDPGEKTFQIM
jgi:hypothetical protein